MVGNTRGVEIYADYDFIYLLQVDELELSKGKATDLLRQHDGNAVKAMMAFLEVPVK